MPAGNSTAGVLIRLWVRHGRALLVVDVEVDGALVLVPLLPFAVSDFLMSAPLSLSARPEVAIMLAMRSSCWVASALSSPVVDGEDVVGVLVVLSSLVRREFHAPAGTRPED